jgi:hypothetical protein
MSLSYMTGMLQRYAHPDLGPAGEFFFASFHRIRPPREPPIMVSL